ncbi:hypothetical protein DKC09_30120 [Klebsiella quasipneumoniae]|uniref:Uncharacterized protein n=1 Tax=Klebsiella quasipneumoniae TaxID=1463165 RepID=A0AAI8NJS3_9ENTR|nr:hypothetical protein DKC11_26460 [Klebsiella quasipneumoniae]AWL61479.1 hypothetical protein DKC00_06725 [Klebsiella quasipneumoniae]AWL77069.1 hypothetical protein DKC09_30120 [Klebsiella quasipneumoniae]
MEQSIRLLASKGQSIRVRMGVCFVPRADITELSSESSFKYAHALPNNSIIIFTVKQFRRQL